MLTKDQTKRIERAIAETQCILAREQRYSPKFQNKKLIGTYECHLAKLVRMLETGEMEVA